MISSRSAAQGDESDRYPRTSARRRGQRRSYASSDARLDPPPCTPRCCSGRTVRDGQHPGSRSPSSLSACATPLMSPPSASCFDRSAASIKRTSNGESATAFLDRLRDMTLLLRRTRAPAGRRVWMWNNATQARRPALLVDGFRPSGRVSARRGAAFSGTNSLDVQRDTSFDQTMVGDAHRVPVESLDRARRENPSSGFGELDLVHAVETTCTRLRRAVRNQLPRIYAH